MNNVKKIYDFEEAQGVIAEAYNIAVAHLEKTFGEQYKCQVTEDVLEKWFDYIQQDIEYLKKCPVCHNIDIEGNFTNSIFSPEIEICYDCYLEEESK